MLTGPKQGVKEFSHQVYIKCVEPANEKNYCLFTASNLDTGSAPFERFVENNLGIECDSSGTIHRLRIAGYTDGFSDDIAMPVQDSGDWRELKTVQVWRHNTQLLSKLLVRLDQKGKSVRPKDDSEWYKI